MEKKEIKKIVFYTGIPRNFRTTSIGYLYEIAQVFPVVLLSEELDEELKKIIENKELFPKLEKVITVNQYTGPKRNIFQKNLRLYQVARETIFSYKPDIVIAPHDIYPFEMYLSRLAKKINALVIAAQEGNAADADLRRKQIDLINAYIRFPRFLPLFIRFFLVQCRKYLGHLLYYWISPVLVREKPFFGKSSFVLRTGLSGMRDADFQIVFSERDYDIYLKAGVPSEKLYILSHPLKREPRIFFERELSDKDNYQVSDKTAVILVSPEETGFKRGNYSFISKEERLKTNKEIVNLISQTLTDWKIYIKPHPLVKNFNELKKAFEAVSDSIKAVDPSEAIDKYIKISKVIIELPLSISTALFTASLLFPEKAIISLDFHEELLGDFYKNFQGIKYINNREDLIEVLNLIKNNKFYKEIESEKKDCQEKEFSSLIDLLNFLIATKIQS